MPLYRSLPISSSSTGYDFTTRSGTGAITIGDDGRINIRYGVPAVAAQLNVQTQFSNRTVLTVWGMGTMTADYFSMSTAGSVNLGGFDANGDLYFARTAIIRTNTTDGSDNQSITIAGGGASGPTRGATILINGNEAAGNNGHLQLDAGNASGAIVFLRALATNGYLSFSSGGSTERWRIESTGNFVYTSTSQLIAADTADGADNKSITIAGGGAGSDIRGAYAQFWGNESASPGNLIAFSGTAGSIIFRSDVNTLFTNLAGVISWSFTGAGDLRASQTNALIRQDTVDGSDNKSIIIAGGGAAGPTRGAQISITGNESGSSGSLLMQGGDTTVGHVILRVPNSSAQMQVQNGAGGVLWSISPANGNLEQSGTNGGDVLLTRVNTSVRQRAVASVTAAGTNSATATVLDSIYNAVGTVAAGTGVRLPPVGIGSEVYVQNNGANDLEVYPPTGGAINAAATDAGITLAAASDQIGVFVRYNTNSWMGFVINAPST